LVALHKFYILTYIDYLSSFLSSILFTIFLNFIIRELHNFLISIFNFKYIELRLWELNVRFSPNREAKKLSRCGTERKTSHTLSHRIYFPIIHDFCHIIDKKIRVAAPSRSLKSHFIWSISKEVRRRELPLILKRYSKRQGMHICIYTGRCNKL